ncbi:hypothetical protein [Actinomadura xylanilytica]|uniref:hypothetical protein n=1 Tax=Actinomadura xylanilytica TaxID=887459 RepID=UPI00255B2E1D|nr:hypothetical protein [Actinomadura xylanilytica]MDL4773718.1 hypothetical protein [Actinomadura xylanilytica]
MAVGRDVTGAGEGRPKLRRRLVTGALLGAVVTVSAVVPPAGGSFVSAGVAHVAHGAHATK